MRTKPSLAAADVKTMLAACEAKAVASGWAVSIAIVDDGGFLLGLQRMDGVGGFTAEVATGKARASALTRQPTKVFEDRVKERPAFTTFPAGVLVQGAVPLSYQGECVGAIGVSGVTSPQDEQVAQAGADALS
jgi:uncharacterized protein GlcG (DUF336 family)